MTALNAADHAMLADLGNQISARLGQTPPAPPLLTQNRAAVMGGAPPRAASAPALQMLTPMMRWDWPAPGTGTMSYPQYTFLDAIPSSLQAQSAFVPAAGSLSASFDGFLQLLDGARFPLPQLLAGLRQRLAPPATAPAMAVDAPDGWAKVPDGTSMIRWRPAYGMSDTPDNWLARTADVGAPVTLTLALSADSSLRATAAGGAVTQLTLSAAATSAVLQADALEQIFVQPGYWFDSTTLRIGRNGPFVGGVLGEDDYAGVLSGRVAGFIVARNPVLKLALPAAPDPATSAVLAAAGKLEVGGLSFQGGAATSPSEFSAPAAPGAWIVAVTVESFL